MRIRAYNAGSTTPGEWSQELHVAVQEEEMSAVKLQARIRGNRNRQSMKCLENAEGVASQGGAAVVEQEDLAKVAEKGLDRASNKKRTDWRGWSEFRRAIGEFYIEVGVPNGADGKLFDLSAQQVEDMSNDPATMDVEGASAAKPLTTLACAGVWVMETLAHFTDDTTKGDWVELITDIDGLVNLCVKAGLPDDPETNPLKKELLYAIIEIYETMRQCEV